MEELITTANYLFSDGFQVVLFEGPGQEAALRKNNLYMTHRWEEPVPAVLGFFNLDDVVLIGISLGGYPALKGGIYIIILRYASIYNWIAGSAIRTGPAADHIISQRVYILIPPAPADCVAQMQYYSVSDIAHQVRQDVLLLAGEEDRMISLGELKSTKRECSIHGQFHSVSQRVNPRRITARKAIQILPWM